MTRFLPGSAVSETLLGRRFSRRTAMTGSSKLALGGALGLAAAGRFAGSAFAQATPAAIDLSMYPELKMTVTDQAVQLSTTTIPSGFVLVTVVGNQSTQTGSIGAGVVGPPAGISFPDFISQAEGTPEAPSSGGTPIPSASPAASNGLPPIAYQAMIPGGPGNIDPGQTGQAIINLPSGTWAAVAEGNQPLVQFTAAPGTPGAASEPATTVTITEIDFGFAGFENIPAGPQIWKVVHQGTQPHMLVLVQVPAGTTMDQIMAAFNAPPNATPAPGGLAFSDVHDRGGIFLQSKGTTVYPVLNLSAGRYVAACFVSDPNKGGELHAMEGMTSLFDVGGGDGTATPTS